MADLAETQVNYYMVVATRVLAAAIFYLLNLRMSRRKQRLTHKTQEQPT